jgi:hypothetical protein
MLYSNVLQFKNSVGIRYAASSSVPNERAQNRFSDGAGLYGGLRTDRSENLEWYLPAARAVAGRLVGRGSVRAGVGASSSAQAELRPTVSCALVGFLWLRRPVDDRVEQ